MLLRQADMLQVGDVIRIWDDLSPRRITMIERDPTPRRHPYSSDPDRPTHRLVKITTEANETLRLYDTDLITVILDKFGN